MMTRGASRLISITNLHNRSFVFNSELPYWRDWAAQSGDVVLVDAVAAIEAALEQLNAGCLNGLPTLPDDVAETGAPVIDWRNRTTRAQTASRGRWRKAQF